MHSNG